MLGRLPRQAWLRERCPVRAGGRAVTSPWNPDTVSLWRERGELKKCVWEMPLVTVFSQRPVGRRKRVWEVGEAGTRPKKLRAVIVKVEKRNVKQAGFHLSWMFAGKT